MLRLLAARDGPTTGSRAAGKYGGSVLWNGQPPPSDGTARKLAAFAPQIDIQ